MEKTDEQEKATNFALKYLEHLIEKELEASESTPAPSAGKDDPKKKNQTKKIG